MPHPIKVLLADESASVRLLLVSLLREDERFAVVADVASGANVIEQCEQADLVVVDLVLSDTDAFSLIGQVHLRRPDLPVVLFAAVDPPYLRSQASAGGAAGFFTHGTDPTVVLDGLVAIVNGTRTE